MKQFDPKKTIFLIDGSTFLYRAYYSMRPLHTITGIPVQAVFNFCRMIKKLIKVFNPSNMVLVWDSKGTTARKEIYSEYKAGRQAPPSDLFTQKDLIVKFADLIELPQSSMQGVEADDIINSITQDYKNKGYEVVIVASDKDMYQLLETNVFVYDPFKEELTDVQLFEQKMGFPVYKLPFYFSLLGDASDNIPGVKGIGKAGALQLVQQFESLEDLYNNIDQVSKERTKKVLVENKDNAFLSYKLFKALYYDVNMSQDKLKFDPNNWENAKPLFKELEFKSFLTEAEVIKEESNESQIYFADEKGYEFKTITTLTQLNELAKYLEDKQEFALDTETNGLSPLMSDLIGFSICAQKGLSYYIPFGHKISNQPTQLVLSGGPEQPQASGQLSKEEIFKVFKPILENDKYKKILHSAKFDQLIFYNAGINLRGITFDTLIAASLVLEDGIRLGLKSLSEYFFQERMFTFDEMVKDKKLKDFSYVQLDDATKYAAADAHQTLALKEVLQKKLNESGLINIFKDIEMPLGQVLFQMEVEGIFVDVSVLKEIGKKLETDIKILEKEIQLLADISESFNLNSPKQIEALLFTKLNLTPLKKSVKRTGYSTDQSVLEELSIVHPVPKLLLKYRELTKLKNTYVDALPDYINPKDGKVHTTFSQTKTATGRLASFDPNLQNIPTDGAGIRAAFKPKERHVFLSADYSQIELRILAYFSQDKSLVNAFLTGQDIHALTAAYLFNVPVNDVTKEQRNVGKRINFSIMYGLTPFGLAKDLKIPFSDAKNYIEKYFTEYEGVALWMDKVIEFAKEKGYVETLFGRRRYVPGIFEKNKTLYDFAKRLAINTPVQGTNADIIKLGMINLNNKFQELNLGAEIILQIHDELLISVPKGKELQVEKITKEVLESVVSWDIPLTVTTRFGDNWLEVTK